MRAVLLLALLLVSSGFLTASLVPSTSTGLTSGSRATLIVSPSGESMLVDTGYETDGRDAKRNFATAQEAGLKRIDHMVISHYHGDHVGGLAALSKMIPLGRFYGPEDKIEAVNQKWFDSFRTAAADKRTSSRPATGFLSRCSGDRRPADRSSSPNRSRRRTESALRRRGTKSVGRFRERADGRDPLDLWQVQVPRPQRSRLGQGDEVACPENKLGKVTVYQAGRHGSFDGAGAPAFLGAIAPQVVVLNNGPRKGLGQVDDRAKSINPDGTRTAPYERNGYLRMPGCPASKGSGKDTCRWSTRTRATTPRRT